MVFTLLDLFASQIPPQVADAIDSLPSQISPQGKFGFFLGDAGKAKFRYRVNDGQNDLAMYLQFEAFQGSSSLPPEWWSPAAVLPEVEEQSYTTKSMRGLITIINWVKLWCRIISSIVVTTYYLLGFSRHLFRPEGDRRHPVRSRGRGGKGPVDFQQRALPFVLALL